MKRNIKPMHPGAVFKAVVIKERGFTIKEVAAWLGVSRVSLSRVLEGHASLSPAMAKRFGKFTNTSTESWYKMQVNLDLWNIENSEVASEIKPEGKVR